MKTLKVSQFQSVIGATRSEIDTWLTRKDQLNLSTAFSDTVAGSARRFTRKNVLELATIVAFVRAGMAVSSAVSFARPVIEDLNSECREWCVFPAGDFSRATWTNDLAGTLSSVDFVDCDAPAFAVVSLGEIRRRVEKLFAPGKVEA
jgi:hypothetical protein